MAEIPLVDLEVILRYSLAIRQETADAREVLEALDQSRAYVVEALRSESDGDVDEPEATEDAGEAAEEESNGEGPAEEPEPQPEREPQPRRQALRAKRPPSGNGEVDVKNLPTPLPKEEAAARRAARRARRSK